MNESPEPAPAAVVLIAEDDPDVLAFLVLAVEAAGYRPICARNGLQAVALLAVHPEATLALIDLHIPGPCGLATIRSLREMRPDLRCCLMSGSIELTPGQDACGVDCVLRKPFSVADVARTLQQMKGTS